MLRTSDGYVKYNAARQLLSETRCVSSLKKFAFDCSVIIVRKKPEKNWFSRTQKQKGVQKLKRGTTGTSTSLERIICSLTYTMVFMFSTSLVRKHKDNAAAILRRMFIRPSLIDCTICTRVFSRYRH